jgi:two-component system response regulator YesN
MMEMLRMVLADDEPVITKGIQMLLNWEQLGFDIIGAYENGQQALHVILTQEPDVAILDISMPGKTGIEILKEITASGCKTRVIFLSGFQDFEYAQTALRFGAVDYLLKPVKKDSLLAAVGKCAKPAEKAVQSETDKPGIPQDAYKRLSQAEATTYILVAVQPIGLESKSEMERQLIWFSAYSILEEAMEKQGGIAFQRRDRTWLVLKGLTRQEAKNLLLALADKLQGESGCPVGFAMGPEVQELQQIAGCEAGCVELLGGFYFYNQLASHVLENGSRLYTEEYTENDLKSSREELLTELFLQNREAMEDIIGQYLKIVSRVAGTRSDTAVFYLLSCIRAAEERLEALGISIQTDDAVTKLQDAATYSQAGMLFREFLAGYYDTVASAMQKDETQDIIKAKHYIENHYAENISLEIMAKQIHMNSFYFSSFFKKHTGQNFKDYLNQIRMKHALELLITTAKKTYEIAEDVGFRDYRYFSDLFNRFYGKTPAAYRKQQKEAKKT